MLSLEQNLLRRVGLNKELLSQADSRALITRITSGACGPEEYIPLGALLSALRIRGESAEEIAGAAEALLAIMQPFDLHQQHEEYYDIVGTGGDGKSTVSVSTATAIALAAIGEHYHLNLAVAKHGNRAVSGTVGSADILRECGLNFEGSPNILREQFQQHGFIFLFAPIYHNAMRHVAPIRNALKFPTIFNCIGPLCNPSNPNGVAIGVHRLDYLSPMSKAAGLLGKQKYFFYSSEDGYDEISTFAPSRIFTDGKHILTINPSDFFEPFPIPTVEKLSDSVLKFRYMLSGIAQNPDSTTTITPELGLQLHNTISLNVAIALYLFGKASSVQEAFELADSSLRQGIGKRKLGALQQQQLLNP